MVFFQRLQALKGPVVLSIGHAGLVEHVVLVRPGMQLLVQSGYFLGHFLGQLIGASAIRRFRAKEISSCHGS